MTPASKTLIKTLHNGDFSENIESIGTHDLKYNIPSGLLCFFDMKLKVESNKGNKNDETL